MFKLTVVLAAVFIVIYAQPEPEEIELESVIDPDGTYHYVYKTRSGIYHRASGVGGESEEGEVRYISAPNDTPIKFTYTADEEGFKPVGDHIPQEPEHIAGLLKFLASPDNDPSDDGSYKPTGDDGSYKEA